MGWIHEGTNLRSGDSLKGKRSNRANLRRSSRDASRRSPRSFARKYRLAQDDKQTGPLIISP
jgi:hypothetical protein